MEFDLVCMFLKLFLNLQKYKYIVKERFSFLSLWRKRDNRDFRNNLASVK